MPNYGKTAEKWTPVFGRSYILPNEKEIYFDSSLLVCSDISRILVITFSMERVRKTPNYDFRIMTCLLQVNF